MPYGFKKSLGGDSPHNDAMMEQCVQRIMSSGRDKVTAIKICKSSLRKALEKKRGA